MSGNRYDKDGWDTDSDLEEEEAHDSSAPVHSVPHIQTAAKVQPKVAAAPLSQPRKDIFSIIREHNQKNTRSSTEWPTV